jgi:iron complex outermembrane receptor protein
MGVSIRGSNARNGFGVRNIQVFEDGFPVTQPDGLSRTDLTDPHAYGGIDVWRGPSSALFGNYATGGAINFRTRPGGEVNGFEYGVDIGSFKYVNNYMTLGAKSGAFEYSLFASNVRGAGHLDNAGFNTQTVNFLGTYSPISDDKFTVKFIHNDLDNDLSIRLSLNQFNLNPFQARCVTAATAVAGCGTINLFANGYNGAQVAQTAAQAGLGRDDQRTILGTRWEHKFGPGTDWQTQPAAGPAPGARDAGADGAAGNRQLDVQRQLPRAIALRDRSQVGGRAAHDPADRARWDHARHRRPRRPRKRARLDRRPGDAGELTGP